MKVLITGATGYIGSHTVLELLENGYEIVGADSFERSSINTIRYIQGRLGPNLFNVNLCDEAAVSHIFKVHPDISAVIHFAAYKSVEESVKDPLIYYKNNINSLISLLKVSSGRTFVFSSSCTVYGEPDSLPVTEQTSLKPALSPYGATKQMCEQILQDWSNANQTPVILLRYFNPAGSHPSLEIGEEVSEASRNLVPLIVSAAAGRRPPITVFGNDYETRDGTCLRDFIHVCDLASAHRLALEYNKSGIFNLGSGTGVTVMEAIQAFQAANGVPVPHVIVARRPGDVSAIYADSTLANAVLGWKAKYNLQDIMQSAYKFNNKRLEAIK